MKYSLRPSIFFLTMITILSLAMGCVPAAMPSFESCGENVTSRQDEEGIVERYFTRLNLFNGESGEYFDQDDDGTYLVNSNQYIAVGYETTFPGHLRLCIQKYDEAGTVVYDNTINTEEQGSWTLQPLEPGQYVMRIIVKNTVIESYVIKTRK